MVSRFAPNGRGVGRGTGGTRQAPAAAPPAQDHENHSIQRTIQCTGTVSVRGFHLHTHVPAHAFYAFVWARARSVCVRVRA